MAGVWRAGERVICGDEDGCKSMWNGDMGGSCASDGGGKWSTEKADRGGVVRPGSAANMRSRKPSGVGCSQSFLWAIWSGVEQEGSASGEVCLRRFKRAIWGGVGLEGNGVG